MNDIRLASAGLFRASAVVFLFVLAACGERSSTASNAQPLALYAYADELGPRTLPEFERRTGIPVTLDPVIDNPTLQTKLLVGHSGYDVVMPSHNFLQPLIAAGALRRLDRSRLGNWRHLDPDILARLAASDPGNQYAVPYVWGTIGIGVNIAMAQRALGRPPPRSVQLLFDPDMVRRLASCGVAWPDAGGWVMSAWASFVAGRDPSVQRIEDLPAIEAALLRVRPYVRYIDSLKVDSDLASGEICVGIGPSGGLLQARDASIAAKGTAAFEYVLPVEGALLWIDLLAIPADAPNADAAHRFIDYMLDPAVIAEVSNAARIANPNRSAAPLIRQAIRQDPLIYPPADAMRTLYLLPAEEPGFVRERTRMWRRVLEGRAQRP